MRHKLNPIEQNLILNDILCHLDEMQETLYDFATALPGLKRNLLRIKKELEESYTDNDTYYTDDVNQYNEDSNIEDVSYPEI